MARDAAAPDVATRVDVTAPVAVVLAGGLGTRMRKADDRSTLTAEQAAAADQGLKALIPVGRPFLDYVLDSLADAGIAEVCIVVSPRSEAIRDRYRKELVPTRLRLEFAVQAEPRGTADAVLAARAVVGDRDFLVVNSDNLYPVPALQALVTLGGPGVIGYRREALLAESNIDPERIARFALIWTDGQGYLSRIVEKPDPSLVGAPGTLVSMNSWRFTPEMFTAAAAIGPSARGELELQDAVRYAIEQLGVRIRVVSFSGGVLDLSSRGDVASVAARVAPIQVRL